MKKIFLVIMTLSVLFSCSKEILQNDSSVGGEIFSEEMGSPYRISLEDALNSLDEFLGTIETKSSNTERKRISDVLYIKQDKPVDTKSEDDTSCVLYVVNFEDEQGYAVLSADTRLPVDIYAVTETGSAEEQDFYVSSQDEFNVLNLIYQSASGNIPAVDTTVKDPEIIPILPPEEGGQEPPEGEWVVTRWGPWYDLEAYQKMLITQWGQGAPYKDLTGADYAGCTVVAVAQVMAYNQYPSHLNDIRMPFDTLRNMRTVSLSSVYADSVALLFNDIYQDCGAKDYGESGSLLWPKDVVPYLERIGYKNVKLHRNPTKFELDIVYNSVTDGYPVIVSALNSDTGLGDVLKGDANSHTWVIDGYVKQMRTGRKEGEKTGQYYGSKSETREFVHCNWGWDGDYDGYFYPGIFSKNEPAPYSAGVQLQSQGGDNYKYFYRIITYTL